MSLLPDAGPGEPFAKASVLKDDLFDCLTAHGDTLFELTDAFVCADGPVTTPVDLTLTAAHRRGHGAMYDALTNGNVDVSRLRQVPAGLPQPEAADGRLVLAVDVTHIAAHTQPRLTRNAAADLRRPWEKPTEPGLLTAAPGRPGFRNLRRTCTARPVHRNPQHPAGAPTWVEEPTSRPPRHDVGKTTRRPERITERNQLTARKQPGTRSGTQTR